MSRPLHRLFFASYPLLTPRLNPANLCLYRAYKSLSPRIRLLFGLGLMANAGLMIAFEGNLGEMLGFGHKAAEEDLQKVWDKVPRIQVVQKEK